jgi:hypothetical protein
MQLAVIRTLRGEVDRLRAEGEWRDADSVHGQLTEMPLPQATHSLAPTMTVGATENLTGVR